MKTNIKYSWGSNFLLIDLGNRIEPRVKMLFLIEFIFTTGMASIFVLEASRFQNNLTYLLFYIGAGLLYLLAGYRLLSRMYYREQLKISDSHFTIIRRTPFKRTENSYDWKGMGTLHYVGKDQKTDHPLKGKCLDYFGFDTQEHLIQDLHHEGNLFFLHHETPVRFAKGIYSWHSEEIIRMIRLYAGSSLRLGAEWKYFLEEEN